MEPILQVNHLKKVFHQREKRDVAAVNDVSFCLYPGEILGIVGESGSGKSTVARLITRLEDVTDGQIILDGQDGRESMKKSRWSFRIRSVPLIQEGHWAMASEKV